MAKKVIAIDGISPELVDEFAPVGVAVDQFRPTVNLHDRLWKRVKLFLEKLPGDKPVTLRGKLRVIELDPCEMKRKVRPVAAVF